MPPSAIELAVAAQRELTRGISPGTFLPPPYIVQLAATSKSCFVLNCLHNSSHQRIAEAGHKSLHASGVSGLLARAVGFHSEVVPAVAPPQVENDGCFLSRL